MMGLTMRLRACAMLAISCVGTVALALPPESESSQDEHPTSKEPEQPASESSTPGSAEHCTLPRQKLSFSTGDSGPIDPNRLGDPEVFRCLLKIAETGEDRYALEWAQILLWEGKVDGSGYGGGGVVGGLFPRSESRLKRYIDVGVARGSHYSILAKAAYLQDVDPAASLELYRRVAMKDDCRGQIMLAWMYQQGVGTERNEAVAYFWARLARRRDFYSGKAYEDFNDNLTDGRPVPYFEQRVAALQTSNPNVKWERKHYCRDLYGVVDLPRLEGAPFAEEVHEALLKWNVGQDAPEALARYAREREPSAPQQTPSRKAVQAKAPRRVVPLPAWRPVVAKFAPAATRQRAFDDLYGELSRSVYVIVAAPTAQDLRVRTNMAQGSAVAVDFTTLITNCHIVEGRPLVFLVNQDGLVPLSIVAAQESRDTCVLRAPREMLSPVARVRSFESLRVGEQVIAIGSPHGFDSTLSVGIVSQLRRRGGQRLVQTSAPISGGSSGGGLFDVNGNLVGITTFSIRDAENLNFAIAADEYL